MGDPSNPSVDQPPARKDKPMEDEKERQRQQQEQEDGRQRQQGEDRVSGKERRERQPGWRHYDDLD